MLYRILLFSVKPQHESAIGRHISPPFESPSPSHPSRLIQSPCLILMRTECTLVYIVRGARDTSVITAFSLVIIVGKHTKPHQLRA